MDGSGLNRTDDFHKFWGSGLDTDRKTSQSTHIWKGPEVAMDPGQSRRHGRTFGGL